MKRFLVKMLLVPMVVGMFTGLTIATGNCADDAEPRPRGIVVQK